MTHPITPRILRKLLISLGVLAVTLAGGAGASLLDACGSFADVPPAICPFVTELFVLGITAGTSPTTFSPDDPLTRGQAAVFTAKAFDQSAARASRRAALGQWWTSAPNYALGLGTTPLPYNANGGLVCDGQDLWAASSNEFHAGAVSRIRASDGRALDTWPLDDAYAVLAAMGRIFVSSYGSPTGGLFAIDPREAPSAPPAVIDPIDGGISSLAFDGSRIWAVGGGQVQIITPSQTTPWPVTTAKGVSQAFSVLFDGDHVWALTNTDPGSLVKLDADGNALQTVTVGSFPRFPTFDGANIWVPNLGSFDVTVVAASTGQVLATLSVGSAGNSLPWAASFDGQRVLVTDLYARVWLFKAADLSTIRVVDLGLGVVSPYQVCNDGTQFFLSLNGQNVIGRF